VLVSAWSQVAAGGLLERGATGTTNELQFFNNAPEPLEDSVRAIDELGGPTTLTTTLGVDVAGNTPRLAAGKRAVFT
jgi:hypothetical protein